MCRLLSLIENDFNNNVICGTFGRVVLDTEPITCANNSPPFFLALKPRHKKSVDTVYTDVFSGGGIPK